MNICIILIKLHIRFWVFVYVDTVNQEFLIPIGTVKVWRIEQKAGTVIERIEIISIGSIRSSVKDVC